MTTEYDQITAYHYAAYRPSLHLQILNESLDQGEDYALGLDIGCGTGQSSIALTNFCTKVIGIEPSEEMLAKAITHPDITYRHYDTKRIDFSDDYFDLITFAGSLYYAKSQSLLDEVIRVSKPGAKIIIYDFDILLDDVLEKLNVAMVSREPLAYDHEVSFDGLNETHIQCEKKLKDKLTFETASTNLAHLLLSSKDNYELLRASFGEENLHPQLTQQLNAAFETENIPVDAMIYSIVYQNKK